jgi:hypothetical protein
MAYLRYAGGGAVHFFYQHFAPNGALFNGELKMESWLAPQETFSILHSPFSIKKSPEGAKYS